MLHLDKILAFRSRPRSSNRSWRIFDLQPCDCCHHDVSTPIISKEKICSNPSFIRWFFKRRAFAAGAVASGSSLGGVIFPIMIRELLPIHGFAWTFRITGFFILGMLVIANLTIRSRLPPRGPQPFSPDMFTKHFKERTYTLLVASSFFIFLGMFVPINFLPLFGKKWGMSDRMGTYLIVILNAASTFGRLIPGYFADRFGRYNVSVNL